jgi:hypothetical protein
MKTAPYPFKKGKIEVISDDGLAQTIMLHLGVWDYFANEVTPATTISMTIAEEHPTHWCLCARHRYNPDPAENGFQIIAYPKSTVDIFAVHAIIREYLQGATRVSVDLVEPKPWD